MKYFDKIVVFSLVIYSSSMLVTGHGKNEEHFQKEVKDRKHIEEHLTDTGGKKPSDMSDEELQFHYFKLHDYDGNKKLDGVEIGKSMFDHHVEGSPPITDSEIESAIDQILESEDVNKDGYIDYSEFISAQRKLREGADSNKL